MTVTNNPEAAQKALYNALIMAQAKVARKVHKEGSADAGAYSYNYVGHEHVIDHVADVMIEFGLFLAVGLVEGPTEHRIVTKSGERLIFNYHFMALLAHVDGGTLSFGVAATAIAGDKAAYVASTAADRTARLRIMALAGSENEDPESGDHVQSEDTHDYSKPAPGYTPSPQAEALAAGHDRELPYPFGKSKGLPIRAVDDGGISFWLKRVTEDLGDPSKSRFHAKASVTKDILEAELEYRAENPF